MARKKKPRTIRVKDPLRIAAMRRVAMHALAAMVLIGLLGVGFHYMRRYVEKDIAFPDRPPIVVMKNRPAWMSDALAMQILKSVQPWGTHSAYDRQLLADTATILRNNAWVKQVRQVRRGYGKAPADTLELDCEFRAPVALVHWKDFYWLVDGEGVKLPEQFTPQQVPAILMGPDRRLNLRAIEGVSKPPVESGQKWPGEDLAAGIELVKILYGQRYADEIVAVDVSNFGGRVHPRDAQLVLGTRYNTRILWGRPINADDFFVEVAPATKLKNLQEIHAQFHRVDGNREWIDIRFDKITYPNGDPTARVDESR